MRTSLFLSLFALVLAPAPSFAVSVQVQGINELYACGAGGCGGNFQGMIGGTNVGGNLTNGTVVQLMCIDYQNDTYVPSVTYNANISAFDTSGANVSNTRFGGSPEQINGTTWGFTTSSFNYMGGTLNLASDRSSALARYQMVGYLASNYVTANNMNDDRIQSAIWQLMSTNPPNPGAPGPAVPNIAGSNLWLSSAAHWYETSTSVQKHSLLSNYRIVTNFAPQVAGNYPVQIQEFLTVVPEPRYVITLGAGLLAAFFYRRRLMNAQNQPKI